MEKLSRQILETSITLAKAEIKLKNEGSYLGILWYLLNPLFTFILLLLIFSDRVGQGIPHYPLYLLLGIIMFNFFQAVTVESTKIIQNNGRVIKSINFPRETLVASVVLKCLFSHSFEVILFIAVSLYFNVSVTCLVYYPVILVFFCLFCFGASLLLSSLNLYFFDLENIWVFVSRLIWLGTPIFYAIGGQNRLLFINLFNPMYYFITIARDIVIYMTMPEWWMIAGCAFYSLLFLMGGVLIFNKLKIKFAEMI